MELATNTAPSNASLESIGPCGDAIVPFDVDNDNSSDKDDENNNNNGNGNNNNSNGNDSKDGDNNNNNNNNNNSNGNDSKDDNDTGQNTTTADSNNNNNNNNNNNKQPTGDNTSARSFGNIVVKSEDCSTTSGLNGPARKTSKRNRRRPNHYKPSRVSKEKRETNHDTTWPRCRGKRESLITPSFTLPSDATVTTILQKAHYTLAANGWKRPSDSGNSEDKDDNYYPTLQHLRAHLCENGIQGRNDLTEEEEKMLELWVRCSIVQDLRGSNETERVVQIDESRLRPKFITSLLQKVGFIYRNDWRFFFPGQGRRCKTETSVPDTANNPPGTKTDNLVNGWILDSPDGLWVQLARFGLPDTCDFSTIDKDARFQLELLIADCRNVETL